MIGQTSIVAGIDPGKTGAIAFVAIPSVLDGSAPELVAVTPLPRTSKGEIAVVDLYHLINKYYDGMFYTLHHAFLEAQWSGVGGKIVKEFGAIWATCQIIGLETNEVQPLAWKKVILPGSGKGKDKQKNAMINQCMAWGIELPTLTKSGAKLHDGCADAIGIATYGASVIRARWGS